MCLTAVNIHFAGNMGAWNSVSENESTYLKTWIFVGGCYFY